MIGEAGPAQPVAPEMGCRGEAGICPIDVGWRVELLRPGEGAEGLLSLLELVAPPHPLPLDPQRDIAAQPHRQTGAASIGGVVVAVEQRPLRHRAAVVKDRLTDQLHLDVAVETRTVLHQEVIGVLIGRRPGVWGDQIETAGGADRQGVTHHHPAGRRLPGGEQGVGPGLIDPGAEGTLIPKGAKRKEPASRSSRLPKMLGASKLGTQSQSIEPSGATRALVWQSERNA